MVLKAIFYKPPRKKSLFDRSYLYQILFFAMSALTAMFGSEVRADVIKQSYGICDVRAICLAGHEGQENWSSIAVTSNGKVVLGQSSRSAGTQGFERKSFGFQPYCRRSPRYVVHTMWPLYRRLSL